MFFLVKVASGLSMMERQIQDSRGSLVKDIKVLSELLTKLGKEIPRQVPGGSHRTLAPCPETHSSLQPVPLTGLVATKAPCRAGWVTGIDFTVSPGAQGTGSASSSLVSVRRGGGKQKTHYVTDTLGSLMAELAVRE